MLTVDSEELVFLNYSRFSDRKVQFIKETFVRFQHFEFSQKAASWDWIRMDGAMFGQPVYEYWIYREKSGIKVQAEKKFGVQRDLFGIFICRAANGIMEYCAYHTDNRSHDEKLDDNL